MSDEETKIINKPLPFEERVLTRLEDISSRLAALEKREGVESLIIDFRELSENVHTYLANFNEQLGVINSELLQVKADRRTLERRVRKLEIDNRPQAIIQDKEF